MPSHSPRIALIHAIAHAVDPINEALKRDWPQAVRMNLLDDSLSADLAASGRGQDAVMHQRFARLAQYAVDCGSDAILFTCSAFGTCIEAVAAQHPTIPVLKPNEAMVDDAAALGQRVGLVATFAPTLVSMPPEFPKHVVLDTAMVEGAMAALNAGDGDTHDTLIAQAAEQLAAKGCGVIALAQFSMARAAGLVAQRTGLTVITPVSSAVAKLKRVLQG
ncbi:MAG: aspartate/glutamate racemase family protein [Burkholderiaceae bacterium]